MDKNECQFSDISECYAIIAQARAFHVINRKRKISDKTKVSYQRIAKRLIFSERKLPIDCAKTKSTFYTYKAAVVSYILDEISKSIPVMDSLKKSNIKEWESEVIKLKRCIDFLSVVGVDQDKQNLIAYKNGNFKSQWTEKNQSTKHKNIRRSKSKRLKNLPRDWSQRLFICALQSKSKHTLAVAVLAISGCRPAELAYGVELSLSADQSIHVHVFGAKTRDDGIYGQAYRCFDVKSDSVEYGYLVDQLRSNQGRLVVKADPGALCDKVSYLSKKVMPQLKEPATAYCFRHRFSGSLHHAGINSGSISQALGHCSDQSMQHYSSSYRSSASGFSIRNIQSARPVRSKNVERAMAKQSAPTLH